MLTSNGFSTRIGDIVQAEMIPSLTRARDIGGAIVTNTGRIVIAAGVSDIKPNHPLKIAVSDDGGTTVREVFTMPATNPKMTYHTTGIAYDPKQHLIVSMFGRTDGYDLLDWDTREHYPFSMERRGDNDILLAMSWDDGETWHVDHEIRLPAAEYTTGINGGGVVVDGVFYFPHCMGMVNTAQTEPRYAAYLARFKPISDNKGGFSGDFDFKYRTLSSLENIDIRYSDETVYLKKLDGSGYLSFNRTQPGPPYRREYDLDHRPICDFERIRTIGFDPRDYDPGNNGPMLIAFGITRLADGNLLYASRYYGTDHHRAGNIFMTSTDEGKTWLFADDYIPWTLEPLTFPNMGSGGNPMMVYAPDGSLVHITSQGWNGEAPLYGKPGGYALCRFKGIDVSVDPSGIVTVDVSPIAKVEAVFIGKISVTDSEGVKLVDETVRSYSYSADYTRVSFTYEKSEKSGCIDLEVVLANRSNGYRPTFKLRVEIK
jgi:hypothetical protein